MAKTKRLTVTVEEMGELLGISKDAAYKAVWKGHIPSIRIGVKLLRVPVRAIEEMLGHTIEPPERKTRRGHGRGNFELEQLIAITDSRPSPNQSRRHHVETK